MIRNFQNFGKEIDPFTGNEFIKKRRNQKYESTASRIAHNNFVASCKRSKELSEKKEKFEIYTIYDFFLKQTFLNSNIYHIELVTDTDICNYLKKIKL